MQSFNAGSGGYKTKLETADAAVKLKVAHLLQGSVEGIDPIDADTKEPPILLALALFRRQDHIGHSVTMWQDLAKSAATPPNVRVFAEMCVVILQIIAQACSVERVNKGHGLVHSKAPIMVRDSNEGRTEKHERSPCIRPAMLGSMKARPRAASADVTLASSSIHGAEYVQQANVRRSHIDEAR